MRLKLDYPRSALTVERDLLKNLAEKETTFAEISNNISELVLYSCFIFLVARNWSNPSASCRRLRTASQNAIFQDFETARTVDVEGRLWEAHLKINTRFRKLLSRVSYLILFCSTSHSLIGHKKT